MEIINVLDIENYKPDTSDIFFFDNNIWMFLFCPLGNHEVHKQRAYSDFLKEIQEVKATIYVNDLVLSEFSNTYFRMDFNQWEKEVEGYQTYKKDYVGTPRYQAIANEIHHAINDIMSITNHADNFLDSVNINSILSHMAHIDFNDSFYLEQARLGNWKIVTDDHDFQKVSHQVPIITKMNHYYY